jgi:hypothetical protein
MSRSIVVIDTASPGEKDSRRSPVMGVGLAGRPTRTGGRLPSRSARSLTRCLSGVPPHAERLGLPKPYSRWSFAAKLVASRAMTLADFIACLTIASRWGRQSWPLPAGRARSYRAGRSWSCGCYRLWVVNPSTRF